MEGKEGEGRKVRKGKRRRESDVHKRTNRVDVKRHEADGTLRVQARQPRKSVSESSIRALKFHPGLTFFPDGDVRPTWNQSLVLEAVFSFSVFSLSPLPNCIIHCFCVSCME